MDNIKRELNGKMPEQLSFCLWFLFDRKNRWCRDCPVLNNLSQSSRFQAAFIAAVQLYYLPEEQHLSLHFRAPDPGRGKSPR